MARRVGIHAAATATRPSAAIVAVCDRGSHGSIPKSRPRIDRAVVSAPAKPRLIPNPTTSETWRTISLNTWLGTSADRETHRHFMSAKSNEVREQAVQTDCREGDSGHAEGAEHPRGEAAGGGLVVRSIRPAALHVREADPDPTRERPHGGPARSQPVLQRYE